MAVIGSTDYLNLERVWEIARAFEPGLRATAPEDFPVGRCGPSCDILLVALKWSNSAGYGFRRANGSFNSYGHVWIIHDGTRTIIDPTLGQFVEGDALRILVPGDEHYDKYKEYGVRRPSSGAP